jgi:hypothetical protein
MEIEVGVKLRVGSYVKDGGGDIVELTGVARRVASLAAEDQAIAGSDGVDEVLLGRDEKRFLYSNDDYEDDFVGALALCVLEAESRQLEIVSAVRDSDEYLR